MILQHFYQIQFRKYIAIDMHEQIFDITNHMSMTGSGISI